MALNVRPSTLTLWLLLGSNVLVGVLGMFFLAQVDRHYSDLVRTSLPLLNDVRSLAWEVTVMQRSINRYPHRAEDEQRLLFSHAEAARQRADAMLAGLRRRTLPGDAVAKFGEVAALEVELDGLARRWRAAVAAGDLASAERLNLDEIQPRYEAFSADVDELARQIEGYGKQQSAAYSADVGRFRSIILGIATWPLWAGVVIAILVAAFFASLAPLLRRLDG